MNKIWHKNSLWLKLCIDSNLVCWETTKVNLTVVCQYNMWNLESNVNFLFLSSDEIEVSSKYKKILNDFVLNRKIFLKLRIKAEYVKGNNHDQIRYPWIWSQNNKITWKKFNFMLILLIKKFYILWTVKLNHFDRCRITVVMSNVGKKM